MNGFDIVLLVLMGVLVVIGLLKGLVRILIGLAALVVAFLVAGFYHRPLAERFTSLDVPSGALSLICYVLLFIGVMLAGALLAWFLRKLIKAAMLSWVDRIAGAALGLLAALLAASLLILPMVAYLPDGSGLLDRSLLAPYVAALADLAVHAVPADLAEKYREKIEEIRDRWRGVTGEVVRNDRRYLRAG